MARYDLVLRVGRLPLHEYVDFRTVRRHKFLFVVVSLEIDVVKNVLAFFDRKANAYRTDRTERTRSRASRMGSIVEISVIDCFHR